MPPAVALSLFWLLYLGGLGVIFPFQSLYFHQNAGLTGWQLGFVLGLRPLMGMISQSFWGVVSDRSGARGPVLAAIALGAGVGYALLPFASGFVAVSLAVMFAAFFGTSVIPMATAASMAVLGAGAYFGRIRVWGTVGFLVMVVATPLLLHRLQGSLGWQSEAGGPSEPGLGLIFVLSALLCFASVLLALVLPRGGALGLRSQRGDTRRLLAHAPYRRAIAAAFAGFLFLQAPIQLFPVFVTDRGGGLDTVAAMWIPMLLVEIPFVFMTRELVGRIGARGFVAIGILADGFRWTLCALIEDLRWIGVLQLLHGVSVAGMIVGLQVYVESVVPERLRSTGQGLLAMIGVSLGGALSGLLAGVLFEARGIDSVYLAGGLGGLALGISIFWLLPKPHRPEEREHANEQ